jgi:hypothetical protein
MGSKKPVIDINQWLEFNGWGIGSTQMVNDFLCTVSSWGTNGSVLVIYCDVIGQPHLPQQQITFYPWD